MDAAAIFFPARVFRVFGFSLIVMSQRELRSLGLEATSLRSVASPLVGQPASDVTGPATKRVRASVDHVHDDATDRDQGVEELSAGYVNGEEGMEEEDRAFSGGQSSRQDRDAQGGRRDNGGPESLGDHFRLGKQVSFGDLGILGVGGGVGHAAVDGPAVRGRQASHNSRQAGYSGRQAGYSDQVGGSHSEQQPPRKSQGARLPVNDQAYPTMDHISSIMSHLQRLEADNRDLKRQVRGTTPELDISPRGKSPVDQRAREARLSTTPPPFSQYESVSKKPAPPVEFNFPPISHASDKLLRQRSVYVVLHELLIDSYVPDSLKRKASVDAGLGGLIIVDLVGWLNAFAVFSLYRGYYFPDLALAFNAYSNIIRGLASRKPDPRYWLEYDQRFRQKMAQPDSDFVAWFREDRDVAKAVKNNVMVQSNTNSSRSDEWKLSAICHICNQRGHISPQCPKSQGAVRNSNYSRNQFNKSEQTSSIYNNRSKPFVSLACSRFNEVSGCSEPCTDGKPHNCAICLKSGHSRFNHPYV